MNVIGQVILAATALTQQQNSRVLLSGGVGQARVDLMALDVYATSDFKGENSLLLRLVISRETVKMPTMCPSLFRSGILDLRNVMGVPLTFSCVFVLYGFAL